MTGQPIDSSATEVLLRRLEQGDPEAQDHLLSRHRAFLRRLIALRMDRRLRQRVDPSDVVQDAQMEAARRLAEYLAGEAPRMPFRLWLRQIARDRMEMSRRRHVEAGRRAVQREEVLADDGTAALASRLCARQATPSIDAARVETRALVRSAVARLPDNDREIVLMRNFEGLSNQEVATVLGVPPATASKRYGRALLRLRTLLQEGGIGGVAS
jgi:RNA polymerase sigma-70 factor (ECF subfamily)